MLASALGVLFKGRNLARLLGGLWVTLRLSAVSILLSVALGLALGMVMTLRSPIIRALTRLWLETIRIVPQLVLLFIVYFGLARAFNLQLSGEAAAVVVFVFWGAGEMGDLVRGALTSIPAHQRESGAALGLTRWQINRYVLIPQTLRRLIPQAINLATRMIKTTSLVMLIGVVEVLKISQQIIDASRYDAPQATVFIYGVVFVDAPNRVEYLTSAKVDIILANFTVIPARAEVVDFALPYMKVALGMVSPDSALITTAAQLAGKTLIVSKGTTAETYFAENHPEVRLLKFDTYTEAFNALLDGRGDALSTDNTEVLAWALENPGFTVGIESLGSLDTIAPAVQKGNDTVRAYIDEEIKALAAENFFHADFDATLKDVYGEAVNPDSLVVEDGVTE